MNADRDNSEQPKFVRVELPTRKEPDDAYIWTLPDAAQRPSPGLTAPDATTDTPDALGGAEGRAERYAKLNTTAIRAMIRARIADMERHRENPGAILRGTVPGLCDEVDHLRAEVERLREINRELVDTHNVYLGHVATVERERDELRAEVKRLRGTLEAANDAVAEAATERAEAAERALAVERARVARVERLLAHLHTDLVYVGDIRAALAEPEATEGGA